MKVFWDKLGRSARTGLVAGMLAIVLALAAVSWWTFRTDYQVLFANLKPQDAVAMTAELEKLKMPYRFDEESASIFVDKAQVHATRIKLMGKDLPLHGAVGFELFNNTDFGMTEFAQKINYQRALQGELTRTILSLSEIRDVRVHLALPEQGLFKQATARPKAAITVTLREGQALRAEQVSGIQRLVAAATPGMTAVDVTVVDQQGIALSRTTDDGAESGGSAASGTGRLELKKETEAQLVRKASAVLNNAFGVGQALASVDVTLNMDQVRTTTEDVIPASTRSGESRGTVVKEKESVRDGATTSADAPRVLGASGFGSSSTQREVEYQVGRRVEQVVSQAGSVRRIQVVAVVRQALDAAQEDKLRRLLAAAVGANLDRGDTVVVQSLQSLTPVATQPAAQTARDGREVVSAAETAEAPVATTAASDAIVVTYGKALLALALLFLLMAALVLSARQRRNSHAAQNAAMSAAERELALQKVQAWMQGTAASAPKSGT